MWKLIVLAGLLWNAGGVPGGHTEMTVHGEFGTKAECVEALPVYNEYLNEILEHRFGPGNAMFVAVCFNEAEKETPL